MQSTASSAGCPAASSAAAQRRRRRSAPTRRCRSARRAPPGSRGRWSARSRSATPVGVDRGAEAEVDHLDLDPHLPRRRRPAEPEAPGGEHQRPVAGREHVGDRRLPAGVAVADVDRHRPVGARDPLQVGDHRPGHLDQLALVDVRRRPVHRVQHPVRDDRRAGDGEEVAAAGEGHREAPGRCGGDVSGAAQPEGMAIPGWSAGGRMLARPAAGRSGAAAGSPCRTPRPLAPPPWRRLWRDWLLPHAGCWRCRWR